MRLPTNKLLNGMCALLTLTATSLSLQAEESAVMFVKSISYNNYLENSETTRKSDLEQAVVEVLDPLAKEGFRTESMPAAVTVESTEYYYDGDISIYDASTNLISDFDDDGFYHRFSVGIDVDTVYSESWVYARLYLSYSGGPWNYYSSSADFHVHGDSELDIFVIETELVEGFPAGYYDIRIELYDADYGNYLVSYGPYDDPSLSTLPLEDSVYDDTNSSVVYSTDVIVAGHGHGGLGVLFIAAFSLVGLLRMSARIGSSRTIAAGCARRSLECPGYHGLAESLLRRANGCVRPFLMK
ncbi:MAG: choice-of-anchor H family protein [Gammaproteobacteria bacterium]